METRYRWNPSILWRRDQHEVVLLDEDSGDAFILDSIAGYIFELLDGTHTQEQIITAATDHFRGDPIKISRDLKEFLSELQSMGIIEEVP